MRSCTAAISLCRAFHINTSTTRHTFRQRPLIRSLKKGKNTHTHPFIFLFIRMEHIFLECHVTGVCVVEQNKKIKKIFRCRRYAHRLGERSAERVPEKRQLCATERGGEKSVPKTRTRWRQYSFRFAQRLYNSRLASRTCVEFKVYGSTPYFSAYSYIYIYDYTRNLFTPRRECDQILCGFDSKQNIFFFLRSLIKRNVYDKARIGKNAVISVRASGTNESVEHYILFIYLYIQYYKYLIIF